MPKKDLNSDPQNCPRRKGAEEDSGQSREKIQSAEGCCEKSSRQIQSR
jgi:hypothetical protein